MKRSQQAGSETNWEQQTAFPIIAGAIERLYREPEKFASKRKIVPLLLRDADSRKLIETAHHHRKPEDLISHGDGALH
jgi:hypothetical protein